MGFFLDLLKTLIGTYGPDFVPMLALSDVQDEDGPQLRFDCEGNYYGVCYEILERLCAGKHVVTWMDDTYRCGERTEKRQHEITYGTTFPMYYAQEAAGTDDLLRMYADGQEMISVSDGFDRKLLSAMMETEYVHRCDNRLYILETTPPACHSLSEAQALRALPCRFTAEYTPYDGALIFRNIASRAVRREIVRAVEDVCREQGKELELHLEQAHADT